MYNYTKVYLGMIWLTLRARQSKLGGGDFWSVTPVLSLQMNSSLKTNVLFLSTFEEYLSKHNLLLIKIKCHYFLLSKSIRPLNILAQQGVLLLEFYKRFVRNNTKHCHQLRSKRSINFVMTTKDDWVSSYWTILTISMMGSWNGPVNCQV